MSETVEHEALKNAADRAIADQLASIDLQSLSFVQLRRLQKVFNRAVTEINQEVATRAKGDNFGDTITVPPQEI